MQGIKGGRERERYKGDGKAKKEGGNRNAVTFAYHGSWKVMRHGKGS